jgi:hypothetical protein
VTRTVEKPGVSPAVQFHLIGNTVVLCLVDVAHDLPPHTERVVVHPLDRRHGADGISQADCYDLLAGEPRRAVLAALVYADACTRGETVRDPLTGNVIAHAPALRGDTLYPKERARGRRVLMYNITHTERRDISPRLRATVEHEGLRVIVLKAGTVAADRWGSG